MAVSMIMAGFSLIHKKVEDFGLIFLDLHFSRGNWAILMDMFFDSFMYFHKQYWSVAKDDMIRFNPNRAGLLDLA